MDDVAAALSAENRRLRAESKQLAARLRAIESSRWHRLNPRRLQSRLRPPAARERTDDAGVAPRAGAATGAGSAPVPNRPPAGSRPVPSEFEADVVARGRFTRSWGLENPERWETMCSELEGTQAALLEIGAFEGLSTCYLLWRLRDSHVTCIDTFEGGLDHAGTDTVPERLEEIFDANVAVVDSDRVRKIVGDSRHALSSLVDEGQRFDFVYVDGSHLGLDVLLDANLSWQLLRPGGFAVFDDYTWAELGSDPLLRPGPAIDSFLTLVAGRFETVFKGEQLGIRKTG